MRIVGTLTPAAFRRLCVDDDAVRSNGLGPRLPKRGIYGGNKELVAAKAAMLRFFHQFNYFTAVSTHQVSAGNISNALGQRAATAKTLL